MIKSRKAWFTALQDKPEVFILCFTIVPQRTFNNLKLCPCSQAPQNEGPDF